jgi:hypothetical protein
MNVYIFQNIKNEVVFIALIYDYELRSANVKQWPKLHLVYKRLRYIIESWIEEISGN